MEDNNNNRNTDFLSVKGQILSKLKVNGNKVLPERSDEETNSALAQRNILDLEYNGRPGNDAYKTISVNELHGSGEEPSGSDATSAENLIGHTDAILFNGMVFNVCVAKTVTEVLNQIRDGKYMQIQFIINFNRSDSASLETRIKDFVPKHADLPRARVSTVLRDGLITVEPNINGFKITALMEILDEESFKELDSLNTWVESFQGSLLEQTLILLKGKGIDIWDMVRSQLGVGLIPRARRVFESKKARMNAAPGEAPVITTGIKEDSAIFADELNEELGLVPLTGSTVGVGTQISVIEVSTNSEVINSWTTGRRDYSYFKKGISSGRIHRISGSYRYTPILSEMEEQVAEVLKELIPYVLTTFENVVRRQMGIDTLVKKQLPEIIVPDTKNIIELFDLDPAQLSLLEAEYNVKVDNKIKETFKDEQTKQIASLLTMLRGNTVNGSNS